MANGRAPKRGCCRAKITEAASANFEFLRKRSAQLHRLAALAEHYFPTDPNTCLIKLRQFAELLAQDAGARAGLEPLRDEQFSDYLRRLSFSGYAPARTLELLHYLRKAGNDAAHSGREDFRTALSALRSHANLRFGTSAPSAANLNSPPALQAAGRAPRPQRNAARRAAAFARGSRRPANGRRDRAPARR